MDWRVLGGLAGIALGLLFLFRVFRALPRDMSPLGTPPVSSSFASRTLMVVLGSGAFMAWRFQVLRGLPKAETVPSNEFVTGGHTSEMAQLMRKLETEPFEPRVFVRADTDHTSEQFLAEEGVCRDGVH